MKFELFDNLDDKNQTGEWKSKKGSDKLLVRDATAVTLRDGEHARQMIAKAQEAGHYAPMGKNPKSSRGHTMYVLNVIPNKNGSTNIDPATFIFADLAGSEGLTTLTKKQKQKKKPFHCEKRKVGVLTMVFPVFSQLFVN
jgi:hypothetical protein